MTGSPSWWELLSWLSTGAGLVLVVLLLVAAIMAVSRLGGVGAYLLLAGGGVQLIAWILEQVMRFAVSTSGSPMYQFIRLGFWTFSSLLVTAGILFIVIRAGGMKARLETLEAIAGQDGQEGQPEHSR